MSSDPFVNDPKPDGRPIYDMMADHVATAAFIREYGADELERKLHDEVRAAMDELGVRAVLWYGERMNDVVAKMEEWTS